MDWVNFVSTEIFRKLSPGAVKTFIYLLAESELKSTHTAELLDEAGKLGTGGTVQSIALDINLTIHSVKAALAELVRQGVIYQDILNGEPIFILGTKDEDCTHLLYLATPVKKSRPKKKDNASIVETESVEAIIQHAKNRESICRSTQRHINASRKGHKNTTLSQIDLPREEEKDAKEILKKYWIGLFEETFGCQPWTQPRTSKERASQSARITRSINSIHTKCGSIEEAKDYLSYVVANWKDLLTLFPSYKDGTPNIGYIANAGVFRKIRGCMITGVINVPKGKLGDVHKRGTDVDWEKETVDAW